MPMSFEADAVIQKDRELSRFYRQNNKLEPFRLCDPGGSKLSLHCPLVSHTKSTRSRIKMCDCKEEKSVNADL